MKKFGKGFFDHLWPAWHWEGVNKTFSTPKPTPSLTNYNPFTELAALYSISAYSARQGGFPEEPRPEDSEERREFEREVFRKLSASTWPDAISLEDPDQEVLPSSRNSDLFTDNIVTCVMFVDCKSKGLFSEVK